MKGMKLRGWLSWYDDEQEKRVGKMVYANEKLFKNYTGFVAHEGNIRHCHQRDNGEIEWMWSTGLKDIKGVEIHQGDIVTETIFNLYKNGRLNKAACLSQQTTSVVVYLPEGAQFMLVYLPSYLADFVIDPHNNTRNLYPSNDVSQLQVIGNIYENKELMK